MLTRRSLFAFLAAAPVGVPAVVAAASAAPDYDWVFDHAPSVALRDFNNHLNHIINGMVRVESSDGSEYFTTIETSVTWPNPLSDLA